MYRLIASDVDRTLLDNNSRLPELNRNALAECKKRGIGVVLATGKTMDSILHLVKDLGLELPQITLNGSVTISPKMEVIRTFKIEPRIYREIVGFIKKKRVSSRHRFG